MLTDTETDTNTGENLTSLAE